MNTTLLSSPVSLRLNRIQKVSKGIRLFLQYGIPLMIFLGLVLGKTLAANKFDLRAWNQSHRTVASDAAAQQLVDSSSSLGLWGVLRLVVYLFWYRTALKLFGFFEKGILFTAETVRCLQILGGVYLVRCLVQVGFYFFVPAPLFSGPMLAIGINDLFTGSLIIFIGWVMDEARKIREEQELTV